MPFLLRNDAVKWFSNISKGKGAIKTDFDLYYFCLIIGMAGGRMGDTADTKQIVQDFVSDYEDSKRLIGALAFYADLNQLGVSLSERSAVQAKVCGHFVADNANYLTDDALKKMNKYASGGYNLLTEKIDAKPHHLEHFLMRYCSVLGEVLADNTDWS
jgi:hypothetical protein